ncbi:hypothetical protein FPANT_11005 [Fusarium pseudoanthophilum]|uniref:Ribonuclease H1 N-terminal domain-containing protein n=1 Tax=Fusarium pseudoanthophilum TaxID=48495 RepID=A0A8H5KN37_9HYPO|nr:hypothetical protein FPANT_11005 [Fusarium pseudoanthophilum]
MAQQSKVVDERWYGIGDGILEGVTDTWYICALLTRRYPGASFRRFSSRKDAEDWLWRIHNIENPVLIDLAAAKAAVAVVEAAAAPIALPAVAAIPAAVPSSSAPSATPPVPMGQILQLLQQSLGDPRTAEALRNLLSSPATASTARSNDAHAGSSGALPVPSSSPDDPVFSPRATHTGRKALVIDCSSDDDAKPSSSRPRPRLTPVPPSSSAASSSTNSTTAEPRVRTVKLARSSDQARSAKRARRMSGELTFAPSAADINDRFVNMQPAFDRLKEILGRGNAVIITEDEIAAPEGEQERSTTMMGLDLSGAYTRVTADQIERWEEMNKSTSKGKGKAKAQTATYGRDEIEDDTPPAIHHPLWKLAKERSAVLRRPDSESVNGGNNSDNGDIGDEGDNDDGKDAGRKPGDGDDGDDSDWVSV